LAGLLVLLLAPQPLLAAGGNCPSPRAISRAVEELVGRPLAASGKTESEIVVEEDGDYFSVSVRQKTRILEDPTRDCDKRAKEAAVFVALMLAPPDFGPDPASEPPPEPAADEPERAAPLATATSSPGAAPPPSSAPPPVAERSRPAPPRAPRTSTRMALGVGLSGASSFSDSGRSIVPGLELLAALRFGPRFGTALEGTLELESRFVVSEVTIRAFRLPWALLARWGVGRGFFVDLGPVLAPTWIRAEELEGAATALRLEAGLRGALQLALPEPSSAPFVRLGADVFPIRPELELAPRGRVGSTPPFWGYLAAGLSWGDD